MKLQDMTLSLSPATIAALTGMAAERDLTPGWLLRELVAREAQRRQGAKMRTRADEPLIARLQRLIEVWMASTAGWHDVQSRPNDLGHEIRPEGGGLTLHDDRGDRPCKSCELGFPYARLVRKFGVPMPGHPHRMTHPTEANAARVCDPDGDLVLIEPC